MLFYFCHEVQAGEPEYLEQPSRADISKHLKEDSVQAINKALAEQEDRGPEAIMDTVRIFWSLKYFFCFYFASENVIKTDKRVWVWKLINWKLVFLQGLSNTKVHPETVYISNGCSAKKILRSVFSARFKCRSIAQIAISCFVHHLLKMLEDPMYFWGVNVGSPCKRLEKYSFRHSGFYLGNTRI